MSYKDFDNIAGTDAIDLLKKAMQLLDMDLTELEKIYDDKYKFRILANTIIQYNKDFDEYCYRRGKSCTYANCELVKFIEDYGLNDIIKPGKECRFLYMFHKLYEEGKLNLGE